MTQAEDIFEKNFSENLTGDYELIDWWSKYYSSIGELARAPNFPAYVLYVYSRLIKWLRILKISK